MRSTGLKVQGGLIMQGIVDKIVIIGEGETAELARSVKELSFMQVKAQQMMQRRFIKSMGSGI
jgi:hypothetical protein